MSLGKVLGGGINEQKWDKLMHPGERRASMNAQKKE